MNAGAPRWTAWRHKAGVSAVVPAALAVLLLGGVAAAETGGNDAAADRESTTRQYPDGRSPAAPGTTTEDRYAPLVKEGKRSASARVTESGKLSSGNAAEATSDDFWFFHVDVQLFNDDDHDGFYHGIDVLFDADTIYETADVYAALYLSFEGGPWNEYAVTDTFRIFGATSDDEYVVVTELESGYPRGSYDLLIDLYDTFDGRLVATIGPEDSSALSHLPLEDFNRDDPDRVVVVDGGGALDVWTVLAGFLYVLAIWLVRRRQRGA